MVKIMLLRVVLGLWVAVGLGCVNPYGPMPATLDETLSARPLKIVVNAYVAQPASPKVVGNVEFVPIADDDSENPIAIGTYILFNGSNNNALEFSEQATGLNKVLQDLGFTEVSKERMPPNGKLPHMLMDFAYRQINDLVPFTTTTPVYGLSGFPSTSTANTTTYGAGGPYFSNTTVYSPATIGVTGYNTEKRELIRSIIVIKLTALPATGFSFEKNLPSEEAKRKLDEYYSNAYWSIDIHCVRIGDKLDPRIMIPKMLNAAKGYIGKSSGQQIEIELPR